MDPALFEKGQSASDVVRMGLEASDHNRAVLVCQRQAPIMIQRFLPRFVIRMGAGYVARRMLKKGVHKKD